MTALTRLKPLTLVDQASEQLLQLVDEQRLTAGASLPSIAELAESFGASRAVIREALKSLEAQGVIEIANGKRARMRPVNSEPLLNYFQRALQVDGQTVREFAEIRIGLELQSVALAVERGSDEELQSLEHTVQLMRQNLHDPIAFAEYDVKFHLQIAHASHNQMLVHLLQSLRGAIHASVRKGLHKRLTTNQMNAVQGFHERVAAALIQRNPAEADAAMRAHFDEIAMSLD